jgi:hypothetical protein
VRSQSGCAPAAPAAAKQAFPQGNSQRVFSRPGLTKTAPPVRGYRRSAGAADRGWTNLIQTDEPEVVRGRPRASGRGNQLRRRIRSAPGRRYDFWQGLRCSPFKPAAVRAIDAVHDLLFPGTCSGGYCQTGANQSLERPWLLAFGRPDDADLLHASPLSPGVFQHAVWLCFGFMFNLRDVEQMLVHRGSDLPRHSNDGTDVNLPAAENHDTLLPQLDILAASSIGEEPA